MKTIAPQKSYLLPAMAALAACATFLNAGTVNTTFSFQNEDLRKDGALYGSGNTYTGITDGSFTDSSATSALTGSVIGNQFRNGTNGQQFVSLFSYDLTELKNFIDANTTASSSVSVTSVSFKLVSTGGSGPTTFGALHLFQTEPFTTSATWSTTDGATAAWSSPFQTGSADAYAHTGGGSPLTANLGGTNPSVTSTTITADALLEWTTSSTFVDSLIDALDRADKTLYLMAARSNISNQDSRILYNRSTAATVDNRPELVVTLSVTTFPVWTGASSTSWATAGNWTSAPATGDIVRFNDSSNANLATVLNQDFDLLGVTVTTPSGPVSIGGANTLTVGANGIDLSAATQNLTITTPIVASAAQSWNVAIDRTLGINGAVSGSGDITVAGDGKVLLGAANVLPNGAGAGNLNVIGTLDLNGFSQSVNALTGSGIVDNTGAGTVTLTVGNNDAAGTFDGSLQDTGGALSVIKTGGGSLTLTGLSNYSGGFTNNGTGNVNPQNNDAFGTGPVVSNAGTIYATATATFGNTLALNSSTLRIGGGGSKTITWNGPVTATGTSGISADGGTGGITLGSTLNIAGATFTSFANGTTNRVLGAISGAGGNLSVTQGTLQLSGGNSYTGTTTLSGSAVLRLQSAGTISSSSNIVINGTGNFTVRNTVGWVYSGTITGEGTGSIDLNTGTNATLAGGISGVSSINVTSTGSNVAISGAISGATSVNLQSEGASLSLSGNNSYTGATSITGGNLSISSIANYSANSAIGAPTSGHIQLGGGNNFCMLNYTGPAASTSRTVQLGDATAANTGVGAIRNNGSGALTFTAANFNPTITGITAARTLWIGGTYTGGPNEIQSVIQNNDTAGAVNLGKIADASTWLLSGANTYTGATFVNGGTLKLGASGSIASSASVSIQAGATLDTTAQPIYTIPGAQPLAFSIDNGGSGSSGKIAAAGLNISAATVTYNFIGTPNDPVYVLATYSSLSGTPSFASVPIPPTGYTLNYAYQSNKIALVQGATNPYDVWKAQITNGLNLRTQDADGDGFNNLQEFLFGTSPIAGNGALVTTTASGGNLIMRWLQRETGATYTLKQSSTLAGGSWSTVVAPSPGIDTDQTGAPTNYDYHTVTLPTSGGKLFFRIEGLEN